MASFNPQYVNLNGYEAAQLQRRANQQSPLDAALQGLNQGVQLAQLPQTLQDQALQRQLQSAIAQYKIRDVQNPLGTLEDQIRQNALKEAPLKLQALQNSLNPEYQLARQREALTLANQFAKPVPYDVATPDGKSIRGQLFPDGTFKPIDITNLVNPSGLETPNIITTGETVPILEQPLNPTLEDQLGSSIQNLGGATLPTNPIVNTPTPAQRIFAGVPAKPSSGLSLPDLLNAGSIDDQAQLYLETGSLPTFGGNAGTIAKSKIINRAAELQKESGRSVGDMVARQSDVKALRTELGQLQAQRGKVLSFAATFDKNLDVAQKLSHKTDRSGIPFFNKWLNAGRKSTGDADVAAFNAAVDTAANEYAKVTSSATGGGVTSDSAREHAYQILNSALTPEQFDAVSAVLKQDAKNREAGYQDRIKFINDSLSGKSDTAPAPTATTPSQSTPALSNFYKKHGIPNP